MSDDNRYERCVSCKALFDTHIGIVMNPGLKGQASQEYERAMASADPITCISCAFIRDHTPTSVPPDPRTYSPLNR